MDCSSSLYNLLERRRSFNGTRGRLQNNNRAGQSKLDLEYNLRSSGAVSSPTLWTPRWSSSHGQVSLKPMPTTKKATVAANAFIRTSKTKPQKARATHTTQIILRALEAIGNQPKERHALRKMASVCLAAAVSHPASRAFYKLSQQLALPHKTLSLYKMI